MRASDADKGLLPQSKPDCDTALYHFPISSIPQVSTALVFLQKMMLVGGGTLLLTGDAGVGKSAMQAVLLADSELKSRWLSCLSGSQDIQLPALIQAARLKFLSQSMQHAYSDVGN